MIGARCFFCCMKTANLHVRTSCAAVAGSGPWPVSMLMPVRDFYVRPAASHCQFGVHCASDSRSTVGQEAVERERPAFAGSPGNDSESRQRRRP